MGKFCIYCGKEMYSGARFCAKCGRPSAETPAPQPMHKVKPVPPSVPFQQPHSAPSKRPVNSSSKSRSTLCVVLAIILLIQAVAVAMYGWPGFLVDGLSRKADILASQAGQASDEINRGEAVGPTGFSNIEISKGEYKAKPIVINVGPDNTVARAGGITVDFGEFNLLEEGQLEIKDLGVKKDSENGFSAHCYDFSLGDVSEFPTYATITLPYEQTENAAERMFVQYYNDKTKAWEIMYSQLNESDGTITFYTDHFSTYAMFDYFEYERGYNSGPLSKVFFSPAKLSDMIDKCYTNPELFSAMIKRNSAEDSGLIDIAINSFGLSNNLSSASDNSVKLVASMGFMSQEISNALGKSFGRIGAGLTAIKLGLSWYESGDVTKAFEKNKYDLIELGLGTAAGALGAAPLTVAAAGVWLAGMTDDAISGIQNDGYENEIEHAYQEFTWEYVSYSNYAKEFGCMLPTKMPARAFIDEMKDSVIVNKGNTWAWLLQREFVKNRDNPQKMFESIEKLLDDYANVFWKLKPNVRKMIAEDIHKADQWQEPSAQEKLKYKEELKAKLRYRLRKLFACIYERCMLDAKQRLLWEIKDFEKHMNSITSFSVYVSGEDGKEIPLSKTEYKDYIAAFAKTPDDKPTIWSWFPGSSENSEFRCTLYNYIAMGSPSCIKFYKAWEDQVADNAAFTLSFTYSAPNVRLKIGNDNNRYYLYECFDFDPRAKGFADYSYQILRIEADEKNNKFKEYIYDPNEGWKVWEEYDYDPVTNVISSSYDDWHIELIPTGDWKAIRGSSSDSARLPGKDIKTDEKVYIYYRFLEVVPLSDGMWQLSETGEAIEYSSFYSPKTPVSKRLQTASGQSFMTEVRAFAEKYGLSLYEGDRREFE